MTLVKSKQRVADHGEVFTPEWMVNDMLDLVVDETMRIDSRFLEPACGSGNFLVEVLGRKLRSVDEKYGSSPSERRHYALLALMCIYGIELLADNIGECRDNMLEVFSLAFKGDDELARAAEVVLGLNLVHGDALALTMATGEPISFAEWGYLGKGKFQRRDFSYSTLTQMSSFAEDTLFGDPGLSAGKHEIFTAERTYAPKSIAQIAANVWESCN